LTEKANSNPKAGLLNTQNSPNNEMSNPKARYDTEEDMSPKKLK
jgi:hypothetical protein